MPPYSAGAGCVADLLIEKLRLYALSGGYQVIACTDCLFPTQTPAHILIPELSFAVYRERAGAAALPSGKRVYARRFFLRDLPAQNQHRLSFCKKAYAELLQEAAVSVRRVCESRRALDAVYQPYFDKAAFAADAAAILRRELVVDKNPKS